MTRKLFLLLLVALLALAAGSAAAQETGGETLTGTLSILSGDPQDLSAPNAAPIELFFLTTDDGTTVELAIAPAARTADLYRLSGQRVRVTTAATTETTTAGRPVAMASLAADDAAAPAPGVVITGEALAWLMLPRPRSGYNAISDPSYPNLSLLLNDCVAAADPFIYFPDYAGINLAFNADLGCCAWGGRQMLTLDGIEQTYGVTWLPPWGFTQLAHVQHEMGHTLGMQHSASWQGMTYWDVWDVMGHDT